MENLLVQILSSTGFPAAVSFYLLVKVSHSLDELSKAIARLDARMEERARYSSF